LLKIKVLRLKCTLQTYPLEVIPLPNKLIYSSTLLNRMLCSVFFSVEFTTHKLSKQAHIERSQSERKSSTFTNIGKAKYIFKNNRTKYKKIYTVWHEIFAGVYFCGLAIFCVLRELTLAIKKDCRFFLLGINFCDFQKVPITQY